MKKLFSFDGPITKYGNQIASMFILNILALLCCVPVFTIGASLTAMHYVSLKVVNDEDPDIIKTYFKAFKQSFKKATKLWLICLPVFLVLAIDFQVISSGVIGEMPALTIAVAAVTIIIIWVVIWAFIFTSRYDNSIRNTLMNSVRMILLYPIKSVIILAAPAVPVLMSLMSDMLVIFAVALGLTMPAYIQALTYRQIFAEIEEKE